MNREVDPNQTPKIFEDGKPVFILTTELTVDVGIMYLLYPADRFDDLRWVRAFCDKLVGKSAVVYAYCPQIDRVKAIKIADKALSDIGIKK